ncbi:hypothetical protein X777_01593 [Ooceraea biroi]|uniref:Uncharacterized protein n=1 Tax=Ooceraea biroi TaxID=2015173 RepID=A0A026WQD6_OOCBI|nr:hypothetical protein X777_01593 [Ooceraea biroi]
MKSTECDGEREGEVGKSSKLLGWIGEKCREEGAGEMEGEYRGELGGDAWMEEDGWCCTRRDPRCRDEELE